MAAEEQFARKYRFIAFWLLAGLVIVASTVMLLPFIPALLWAMVLSVLMYPVYRRWEERFSKTKLLANGRSGTAASLLTVTSTLLVILVPFVVIGIGLFAQIGGISKVLADETGKPSFESALTHVDEAIKPFVDQVGGNFSVKEYVLSHKEEIGQNLRAPLTKFAGQAGFTLLTLVIALLSMFFMLRDGESLRKPALELIPLPPDKTNEILERVAETIRAVFIGTVLVALMQGAVMGLLCWWAKVPNSLLVGVATAILGLIPLVGPPVLYIPIGLYLLSQGNTPGGLIMLVGGLVVSQMDNLLRPFLIGGRVNLHPLAIFFSILGCVLWIGPIGIMAGPMVLTILLALVEVIRAWVSHTPETADVEVPEPTEA